MIHFSTHRQTFDWWQVLHTALPFCLVLCLRKLVALLLEAIEVWSAPEPCAGALSGLALKLMFPQLSQSQHPQEPRVKITH